MSVYRFATRIGEDTPGRFDSSFEDNRLDIDREHSPISVHDEENRDIKVARALADEAIMTCGALVDVHIRTDNADYDSVWDEDPDPTYWEAVPMKAYFKPQPLEAELTKFGADVRNTTEVIFSHKQLHDEFGDRMLRPGDVIRLPYNAANINPGYYRVVNGTPSGNYKYVWLYFTCNVETLTADITVRPKEDMQEKPLLDQGGQYRESI